MFHAKPYLIASLLLFVSMRLNAETSGEAGLANVESEPVIKAVSEILSVSSGDDADDLQVCIGWDRRRGGIYLMDAIRQLPLVPINESWWFDELESVALANRDDDDQPEVAVYRRKGEYLLHYDVKTPLIGTADIKIKTIYAIVPKDVGRIDFVRSRVSDRHGQRVRFATGVL